MLSILCTYAAAKGLPYEFVDWALDMYGHDIGDIVDIDAIAADWWNTTNLGIAVNA